MTNQNSEIEREFYKMPCGRCASGTYAYQAVIAGINTFRGCASVKDALRAAPRCQTDPKHICYGARDFIRATDFPLSAAVEAQIMGLIVR